MSAFAEKLSDWKLDLELFFSRSSRKQAPIAEPKALGAILAPTKVILS